MDGGDPAGTSILPGDDGCLITSMRMRTTTMAGNRRTNPSGTEMEELPFSRMRRRKNDNLDPGLAFSDFSDLKSSIGAVLGSAFARR